MCKQSTNTRAHTHRHTHIVKAPQIVAFRLHVGDRLAFVLHLARDADTQIVRETQGERHSSRICEWKLH